MLLLEWAMWAPIDLLNFAFVPVSHCTPPYMAVHTSGHISFHTCGERPAPLALRQSSVASLPRDRLTPVAHRGLGGGLARVEL